MRHQLMGTVAVSRTWYLLQSISLLSRPFDGDWTFSAALPFHDRRMENETDTGQRFRTAASGVGDLLLGVVRRFPKAGDQVLLLNLGLGVPTGSISEKDADANGTSELLPYVMQPGTGTWNLYPGFTWLADAGSWNWGASGQWVAHLGTNSSDYTVGDTARVSGWASRRLVGNLSGYFGAQGYFWSSYSGQDPSLDPLENPLNDPRLQGGNRADLLAGLSFDFGRADSLQIDVGAPVDEWVDGPQLSTQWFAGVALRLTW